jgi:hypothetical protein
MIWNVLWKNKLLMNLFSFLTKQPLICFLGRKLQRVDIYTRSGQALTSIDGINEPQNACFREIEEETGLKSDYIKTLNLDTL